MDKKDNSPYDKVVVSFGNNFRVVQLDVYDMLEKNIITATEYKIWSLILKHVKPNSTELSMDLLEFSKQIGMRKDNLRKHIDKLKQLKLLFEPKKDSIVLNLNMGARGNINYRYIYDLCDCQLEIKKYTPATEHELIQSEVYRNNEDDDALTEEQIQAFKDRHGGRFGL